MASATTGIPNTPQRSSYETRVSTAEDFYGDAIKNTSEYIATNYPMIFGPLAGFQWACSSLFHRVVSHDNSAFAWIAHAAKNDQQLYSWYWYSQWILTAGLTAVALIKGFLPRMTPRATTDSDSPLLRFAMKNHFPFFWGLSVIQNLLLNNFEPVQFLKPHAYTIDTLVFGAALATIAINYYFAPTEVIGLEKDE